MKSLSLAALTALPLALGSCEEPTEQAELRAAIDVVANAPFTTPEDDSDIKAVLVDLETVEIRHAEHGWIPIFEGPTSYNLLDLDKLPYNLSVSLLPEGSYDSVRFTVSDAQVIVIDVAHPLEIPSGEVSKLTIDTHFCVDAGAIEQLNLEWTLDEHIHFSDEVGYWMEPSIQVVSPPTCADDLK